VLPTSVGTDVFDIVVCRRERQDWSVIWSTLYISWIRLVIPVFEDLPQRRSWWLDKGILVPLVSPGTALTSWSADE
jgi:hypothetical protein